MEENTLVPIETNTDVYESSASQTAPAAGEVAAEIEVSEALGQLFCVKDKEGIPIPLFHIYAVIEENTDFCAVFDTLVDVPIPAVLATSEFIYRLLQLNSADIDIERLIVTHGHSYPLFEAIQDRVVRGSNVAQGSTVGLLEQTSDRETSAIAE